MRRDATCCVRPSVSFFAIVPSLLPLVDNYESLSLIECACMISSSSFIEETECSRGIILFSLSRAAVALMLFDLFFLRVPFFILWILRREKAKWARARATDVSLIFFLFVMVQRCCSSYWLSEQGSPHAKAKCKPKNNPNSCVYVGWERKRREHFSLRKNATGISRFCSLCSRWDIFHPIKVNFLNNRFLCVCPALAAGEN